MDLFLNILSDKLKVRARENAHRELPGHTVVVDFSLNDYLGIAKNKRVLDDANIGFFSAVPQRGDLLAHL